MDASVVLRGIVGLGVIAAVLVCLQTFGRIAVLQNLGAARGGRRLVSVVETIQLPGAAALHVVRIGDTYALVGRSANFIGKVADVAPACVDAWLTAQTAPLAANKMAGVLARLIRPAPRP